MRPGPCRWLRGSAGRSTPRRLPAPRRRVGESRAGRAAGRARAPRLVSGGAWGSFLVLGGAGHQLSGESIPAGRRGTGRTTGTTSARGFGRRVVIGSGEVTVMGSPWRPPVARG